MRPLLAAPAFSTPGGTAERMGVFVGIQQMEYGGLAAAHLGATGAFTATGTPFSVAAGRLSFHYGLKGPPYSLEPVLRMNSTNVCTCSCLGRTLVAVNSHLVECHL